MKQQTILRKILAELKSEKPDLSYLRGLVEGLVEEEYVSTQDRSEGSSGTRGTIPVSHIVTTNEEEIPDSVKPGPLGRLA